MKNGKVRAVSQTWNRPRVVSRRRRRVRARGVVDARSRDCYRISRALPPRSRKTALPLASAAIARRRAPPHATCRSSIKPAGRVARGPRVGPGPRRERVLRAVREPPRERGEGRARESVLRVHQQDLLRVVRGGKRRRSGALASSPRARFLARRLENTRDDPVARSRVSFRARIERATRVPATRPREGFPIRSKTSR